MYLKDTKKSLWHQFSELYPNGIKRTAFMTRLENSRFIYRDDLGGLCLICNEYGFGVFENMITLICEKIEGKNAQVCLYKIIYKNFKQYLIFWVRSLEWMDNQT